MVFETSPENATGVMTKLKARFGESHPRHHWRRSVPGHRQVSRQALHFPQRPLHRRILHLPGWRGPGERDQSAGRQSKIDSITAQSAEALSLRLPVSAVTGAFHAPQILPRLLSGRSGRFACCHSRGNPPQNEDHAGARLCASGSEHPLQPEQYRGHGGNRCGHYPESAKAVRATPSSSAPDASSDRTRAISNASGRICSARSSIRRAREKMHALGALDLALWDIRGKALNQPVHALLGGMARNYCECYNTGGIIPGIERGNEHPGPRAHHRGRRIPRLSHGLGRSRERPGLQYARAPQSATRRLPAGARRRR